jgi:hypothetical protein
MSQYYFKGSGAPGTTPLVYGASYTDLVTGDVYISNGITSSANWQKLTLGGAVDSVNSKTGVVVINKTDIGLSNVVNADTTTTMNITDSFNKRFVTDANLTTIANQSGTNSGDQDLSVLVTKTTTINGHTLSSNVSITASDVGADASGTASSALSAHVSALDPHTQYLTSAEGSAAYDAIGSSSTVQTNLNTHTGNTSNPHSTTAAQVGLGNVTNDAQLKLAAGDINSLTSKATPVGADVLLIEDSANLFNKKKILISSLPSSGGGGGSIAYSSATLNTGTIGTVTNYYEQSISVPTILSTNIVNCWLVIEATSDHDIDDLTIDPPKITCGNVVASTGFTIYVEQECGTLFGNYKIGYSVA